MKKTPNCFWSQWPDVSFRRLLLPVKIVVILLFCGLVMPAHSLAADNLQQATVTGTVTDAATGEAMAGVNIQVKGTTQGAITDIAGKEWAVSYLVSRQADRSWRVGACVVAPAKKRLST